MNKKNLKILLVEDNLADADLINELLEEADLARYLITSVDRLSDAIASIKSQQFDVILLDLSLPDSRGLDTLEKVVFTAPTLPVLVLTGLTDRELAVQAVRQGAQDYLVKGTFDCDLLVRSISYAMERKQTLEQLRRSEEQYHQLASELDVLVQERTAQLQQALEVEAMLKRITDKVRDSLDQNQIIETAVRELTKVMKVNITQVSLYDPKKNRLTIAYEARGEIEPTSSLETVKLSHRSFPADIQSRPQLYQQLMAGECFQFSDLSDRLNEERETILACPLRYLLTRDKTPQNKQNDLRDNQENTGSSQKGENLILGYLWLRHDADREFTELEVRLVQQVASQCAIALRQAQLYEASLAQVKELERLHQLKDDFLCTVCHELRTPMANIKMALDMLEILGMQKNSVALLTSNSSNNQSQEHPRSPNLGNLAKASVSEKMAAYIKMAQGECDQEIKLINDLLDLQRLEAEVDPIDGIPLDLNHWLPHLTEAFQDRIAQCEHILEVEIDPKLPLLVTDPTALGRVVSEMLNNACKYTPTKPGEVIRLSANCDENKLYLSVSNSGVEIPESELPHIFEKFYRIPSTDPWKQGGTGLGLALIQKLMSYLGGSISVNSGNGQTTFTLEFPSSYCA